MMRYVKFQNIICYYQTPATVTIAKSEYDFKTSYVITKHMYSTLYIGGKLNFKTSYVITKLIRLRRTQRIIHFKTSYVITKRSRNYWRSGRYVISKHHMLLPNLIGRAMATTWLLHFKTSYVITKPTVLSHPSIR